METGTPDQKGTTDGWLNRLLAVRGTCEGSCASPSPFRGVSMTAQTPRIFEGVAPVVAMDSLDTFMIRGDPDASGASANADFFNVMRTLMASNWRRTDTDLKLQFTPKRLVELATLEGARRLGVESFTGSLKPGKLADVTGLSKDILTIPEQDIPSTKVLYTIVGGQVAYEAK